MKEPQNPFAVQKQDNTPAESVRGAAETERAAQEVQAGLVIAKRFPRDQVASFNKIMQACKRPTLAEKALYAYPRGNETVTGPSIRLAEAIAQQWGNMTFGVQELSQGGGVSVCRAYCWDLESNTRQEKEFAVPHKRFTKRGVQTLTDSRDIYELVANQGARRMRACILGVIPGDLVEAAVEQVGYTLSAAGSGEPLADRVRKMVVAFDGDFQVSQAMLEKRLGHKVEATTEAELVQMKAIYRSIRDGFAGRDAFFEVGSAGPGETEATSDLNSRLNLGENGGAKASKPAKGASAPAQEEKAASGPADADPGEKEAEQAEQGGSQGSEGPGFMEIKRAIANSETSDDVDAWLASAGHLPNHQVEKLEAAAADRKGGLANGS